MTTEKDKVQAVAAHLLQLGDGSSAASISSTAQPPGAEGTTLRGPLDVEGKRTAASRGTNQGLSRGSDAVGRLKELPVVDGQFDDAPEPPTLPPLRSTSAHPAPNIAAFGNPRTMAKNGARGARYFSTPYGSTTNHQPGSLLGQVPPATVQLTNNRLPPFNGRHSDPPPQSMSTEKRGTMAGVALYLPGAAAPPQFSRRTPGSPLVYQHIAPRPNEALPLAVHHHAVDLTRTKAKNSNVQKRARTPAYGTILGSKQVKNNNSIAAGPIHQHPSPLLIPESGVPFNQRLPEQPHVPGDGARARPIAEAELRDTDVLFGRGNITNIHRGNIWFRNLIAHYRLAYCTLAKGLKRQLAVNFKNYVRCCQGRFLERDTITNTFYECGDERAVLKCGQALREGAAAVIRNKLLGKSDSTKEGEEETSTTESREPDNATKPSGDKRQRKK